jgi:hypothetical protein
MRKLMNKIKQRKEDIQKEEIKRRRKGLGTATL